MEVHGEIKVLSSKIPANDNNKMNQKSQDDEEERCRSSWLRWRPTSKALLRECEEKILSYVSIPHEGFFVNVGPVVGKKDCRIWTLCFNKESTNTPLVLVHGMGAGGVLWVLNFEELAQTRPVYAIDILGFGRSSRPNFSSDAKVAENQLVESIEAWREEMKLDKFVLVGHSLGGYLVTSYSLKYPDPVSHLILADPWGFKDKPADLSEIRQIRQVPNYVRVLAKVLEPLNPLWAIRAAGPMGPGLIQRFRSDIIRKYECLMDEDAHHIAAYLYHSNAQDPSGESAFHAMMESFGWAKNPMHYRIADLDNNVPLTLLYGGHSWVDHFPSDKIKEMRPDANVDAYVIDGAGHHIYADEKEDFNEIVLEICSGVDQLMARSNFGS